MDAIKGRLRKVNCAPNTFPCPRCGTRGKRKGFHCRLVYDLEPFGGLRTVELRTGEYRAQCGCCKTFRSHPQPGVLDLEPRAKYSNRVRDAVLARFVEDGMNAERLRQAIARDFQLELSDGFVYDCLDWKVRQVEQAEYRAWTLAHFSGTLCVDELHLGRRILLMATDPIGDFVVAFALVDANDQEHMGRFLGNLKTHGFEPKVVVSDGSNLYPALIAQLWPKAKHQLCVFHLLKEINEDILDALRRWRRELLPKRQPRVGKRGRPNRRRQKAINRAKQAEEKSAFIWKHRHLIVTRPENLDEEGLQNLQTMFHYLPKLKRLRAFALEVSALFDPKLTRSRAWWLHRKLQANTFAQKDANLKKALKKLRKEKFAKAISYLEWTRPSKIRTNNHVERMNRTIRLFEKTRYCWRRRRTIVRFIVLSLAAWFEEEKNRAPKKPKKRLKRRKLRKPKP